MANPFLNVTSNEFAVAGSEDDARDHKAQIKYDEIVCARVKNLKSLVNFPLKQNVQYRIVTTHSFNAIVVLDELLKNYTITELYIAVYRMNRNAVNRLASVIISHGIPVKLLLSSFFRENKKYEKWCEELVSFCATQPNATIGFCCNHAKVMLAKTKCSKHIVFEGSGNLSDNVRIEQYILEDCEKVYDFHAEWIDEVLSDLRGEND